MFIVAYMFKDKKSDYAAFDNKEEATAYYYKTLKDETIYSSSLTKVLSSTDYEYTEEL